MMKGGGGSELLRRFSNSRSAQIAGLFLLKALVNCICLFFLFSILQANCSNKIS